MILPGIVAGAAASAPPTDPDFASVALLLHGNGTNGSTTIVDSSSHARTPASNSATITTSQSVFGGGSINFNGSQATRYADDTEFSIGSGLFSLQLMARFSDTGTLRFPCGQGDSSGSNASCSIVIQRTVGNRIRAIAFSGPSAAVDITGTTAISSSTWYYIGFGRDTGNVWRLYVGTSGTANLDGSATVSTTVNDSSNQWGVGALGELTSNQMSGQIDELRLTVGVYRSDLATVPTAAYPNS